MNSSPTPIRAEDVMQFIPHRPPMVWISEILTYSKTAGECQLHMRPDGLYMGAEGLRASSCLEFIAQAFGFIWACYISRILDPKSKGMERAMLVSFKDAKFAAPEVLANLHGTETIRLPITGVRAVGPITAFHGEAWVGDTCLCSVEMRTFCE